MADPVPFLVNNHYYQVVSDPNAIFNNVLVSANQMFYRGLSGYLATITTQDEQNFVAGLLPSGPIKFFIGGSDSAQEGVWRWVDGPEKGSFLSSGFIKWNTYQPNGGLSENALMITESNNFAWDDTAATKVPQVNNGSVGYVVEYGDLPPSFVIIPSTTSVNEGDSVTLTIVTKNIEWGKSITYSISGITQTDLSSGSLTGTALVSPNGVYGQATVTLGLAADRSTEGKEILTFNVSGTGSEIAVNDTSTSPVQTNPILYKGNNRYYSLVSGLNSWAEALEVSKTLSFNGLQGYLATITSQQEDTFVFDNLVSSIKPPKDGGAVGLGGLSNGNGGAWKWVNGPENDQIFSYVNWNVTQGTGVTSANYVAYSLSNFSWNPVDVNKLISSPNSYLGFVMEYGGLTPSYSINSSSASVDEGGSISFTISTKNVEWNTAIPYTITGISQADLSSGALSGVAIVSKNEGDGRAIITLGISADQLTEGPETLTINVFGLTSSVLVNDTSTTPIPPIPPTPPTPPVYLITPSSTSVDEGSSITFTISGKNIDWGKNIPYTISGISQTDLSFGSLSGNAMFMALVDKNGVNGQATVTLTLAADQLTEGPETLTINVFGTTSSAVVNDSSTSPVPQKGVLTWIPASYPTKIIGSNSVDTLTVLGEKKSFSMTSNLYITEVSTGFFAALSSIERIKFNDVSVAIDFDGNAGKAISMIGALFGKEALSRKDLIGIALKIYDDGKMEDTAIARFALDSLLGKNPSNKDVVDLLYKNITGVMPDAKVEASYMSMIEDKTVTQEWLTLLAANLELNKLNINLVGLSKTGIEFTPLVT